MSGSPVKTQDNYDWMDRKRFLKHYHLELAYEFARDGNAAEWAENGHRFWGEEDSLIELCKHDPDKNAGYPQAAAALSPDNRFLAVSTNAVIRLYDVQQRHFVSHLRGHDENIDQIHFAPQQPESLAEGANKDVRYTLVSSGKRDFIKGRTIVWHLDKDGEHIDAKKPQHNEILNLTNGVTKAITLNLRQRHDLPFRTLRNLRENIQSTITTALDNPPRPLHAELPAFGFANPISPSGTSLITLEKNQTTQFGLRRPEEMPRLVIRSLTTLKEEWRLAGHQDTITWAGWSPDGKHVAEASWDQMFGVWDTSVRDKPDGAGHLIGPTGNQNWVGDFSHDGKYVVFSGGSPAKVAVYEVASGAEVARLPGTEDVVWVRELRWSPVDYTIAVTVDFEVVLWRPLDGNAPASVLKLETDGTLLTLFNELKFLKWVDDGRKLVVRDTANTVWAWDIPANKKWRFQRPDGEACKTDPKDVLFVKEMGREGALLSLDGDGKVRYWNL